MTELPMKAASPMDAASVDAPQEARLPDMRTKPLVYIAGPYTKPDPVLNTRAACLVADRVTEMGAAVFIPHLSLFWHAISPQDVDVWYERDFDVLRHCHALVQLPGESTGTDAEVALACRLGLPVFTWPVAERHLGVFIGKWRP